VFNYSSYTVRSRFFELPRQTKIIIGAKNRIVREIGGKITVFDSEERETPFGSSYREVLKNEGSRSRNSTLV